MTNRSHHDQTGGGRKANIRHRYKNNNPPDISNDEVVFNKDTAEGNDNIANNRCITNSSLDVSNAAGELNGPQLAPSSTPTDSSQTIPETSPPPSPGMGRTTTSTTTSSSGTTARSTTAPSPGPSNELLLDPESDSDMALHPDQQNRTRQKKFAKNFKGLPVEETVHKRYACALVGDILLQGHLYVTENYLGFHSNVFGYVTRIQIPLTSVISITKEKTAKIIPNAVAVSTVDETHTFTSLISRDATFKAMTKSWRKAIARHHLSNVNDVHDIGVDDMEDEDEIDGDHIDYESTDSMTSANQLSHGFILAPQKEPDSKSFLIKRSSTTSNAVFYNARPCLSHQNSQQGITVNVPAASLTSSTTQNQGSLIQRMVSSPQTSLQEVMTSFSTLPSSTMLLVFMIVILVVLFIVTAYLVLRLETLQMRVESSSFRDKASPFEQLASWQNMLHSQSSKKIQEYLDLNLQQIAKVRENLDKLSEFLSNAAAKETENGEKSK